MTDSKDNQEDITHLSFAERWGMCNGCAHFCMVGHEKCQPAETKKETSKECD